MAIGLAEFVQHFPENNLHGLFPFHQFPLPQFPLCQLPLHQFLLCQLPTSSIPTLSTSHFPFPHSVSAAFQNQRCFWYCKLCKPMTLLILWRTGRSWRTMGLGLRSVHIWRSISLAPRPPFPSLSPSSEERAWGA